MEEKKYLTHVNGLRGLAILLIFLFHLREQWCPQGYYGVDVFFVISGFFLVVPLMRRMEKKQFSLFPFYGSKCSRIFPGVVICSVVILLVDASVMPAIDFEKNAMSALSVLFGVSNLYFGRNAVDYFASDVKENPFLHTWYISALIQILVIMPAICWVLNKFKQCSTRCVLMFAVCLVSFLIYYQQIFPSGIVSSRFFSVIRDGGPLGSVYYMTASRLWEVMAGAFIYLMPSSASKIWRSLMVLLGLILVIIPVVLEEIGTLAPLAVVIGTMLIVKYGENTHFSGVFNNRILLFFGTISFSFYLVHWPVMAVWRYACLRDFHLLEIMLVALCSLGSACMLYHVVERRKWTILKTSFLWSVGLAVVTLAFLIKPSSLFEREKESAIRNYTSTDYSDWSYETDEGLLSDYPHVLEPISRHYAYVNKSQRSSGLEPLAHVGSTTKSPNFILLGDSYANALFPGLDYVGKRRGWSGVYINAYVMAFANKLNKGNGSICECPKEKYDAMMKYLVEHKGLKYIFVAHPWLSRFRESDTWSGEHLCGEESWKSSELGFRTFCEQLKSAGKTVVVLYPLPVPVYDHTCRLDIYLKRMARLGHDPFAEVDVSMSLAQYNNVNDRIRRFFDCLAKEGLLVKLDPVPALFVHGRYNPICQNHELIMYDKGHLTAHGSIILIERLGDVISQLLSSAE